MDFTRLSDTKRMACFVVLVDELHFTRAAARLGMTQSALSQQIAKLEAEVGVTLLDRASRRVSLTAAGEVFLAGAREMLAQAQGAAEAARRAAQGEIGQLSLGFADAAPLGVLPHLVSRFRAACPEVRLRLIEMLSAEAAVAIGARRLDAALLRPMPEAEGLEQLVIWRERYVVALPAAHHLATRESVPLEALHDEAFVATSPTKSRYIDGRFRAALAQHGLRPRIVQEVNQLTAVAGLVGAGIGIAFMPTSAARLAMDGVVYKPLLGADMPTAEMVLAWHPDDATPTVARLVAVARSLKSPS